MHLTSEDIKDMLEAESALGLVVGTNLFIGREPAFPNDCVTILDTYSSPPQLTFDNAPYYYTTVMIKVRGTDYRTTGELAQSIMEALHGRAGETWNATLYTVIKAQGSPALLDWDDNGRCKFVINFNTQRR
jgi:hypothetical protein